jgi:hypothetical protein
MRWTRVAPAGFSSFAAVVRDLDATRIEVEDLGLKRPTLDDIFCPSLAAGPRRWTRPGIWTTRVEANVATRRR